MPTGITAPVTEAGEGKAIRFRAGGVTSQRKRLGLSAADYGKLIGVSGVTVYKWEHGGSRPRKAQLAALAAIRGLGKGEAMERLAQMGTKGRKKEGKKER